MIRKISTEDVYTGLYKGNVFIDKYNEIETEEEKSFKQHKSKMMQKFMQKNKVWLYLYVLEGFNLPQRDMFSLSDPYLIIKAGDQKIDVNL